MFVLVPRQVITLVVKMERLRNASLQPGIHKSLSTWHSTLTTLTTLRHADITHLILPPHMLHSPVSTPPQLGYGAPDGGASSVPLYLQRPPPPLSPHLLPNKLPAVTLATDVPPPPPPLCTSDAEKQRLPPPPPTPAITTSSIAANTSTTTTSTSLTSAGGDVASTPEAKADDTGDAKISADEGPPGTCCYAALRHTCHIKWLITCEIFH